MGLEFVVLGAGDNRFSAWTKASVTYSATDAARAFAFEVTDALNPIAEAWNYPPGENVTVTANGDLVCMGIIDKMTPSHDANNHNVNISGRSKSKDTIDSAAEHETGEFRDKTALEIAKALDKQGVGFSTDTQLEKIALHRVNPGESVFECVERAIRKQQLTMMGLADGSIQITKGGSKRVHPPLVLGVNILGGNATFDESGQHSEYKVKGQKVFGSDKGSLRVEQVVKNPSVKRHRPKHVLSEGAVEEDTAKKRASHHRDRQTGLSITASIKTQGWHDDAGSLWLPNTLVYIYDPILKLDMDLLLNSVSLTHGPEGSFSQLSFVQPKALDSNVSTGSKTDAVWQ